MSEKEKKSGKAAAAAAPKKNEGVSGKIIDELSRVHMRIPKYEGMKK